MRELDNLRLEHGICLTILKEPRPPEAQQNIEESVGAGLEKSSLSRKVPPRTRPTTYHYRNEQSP